MADFFGCSPGELFPEDLPILEDNRRSAIVRAERMYAIAQEHNPNMLALLSEGADRGSEQMELEVKTEEMLGKLKPRERIIVEQVIMNDRTLDDVGQELGISHEKVLQILAKALRKLRGSENAHKLLPWLQA